MKSLAMLFALSGLFLYVVGCSEQTKTETQEAVDAAGEAVESAAADAKANAEKAGEELKEGAEKLKEGTKEAAEGVEKKVEEATSTNPPLPAPGTNP
jgi:F0F1-type ATP synthase membrane subunit b/b'